MIKSLNGIKATNAMMFTHDGLLIWILKTMPYGFAEHICLLHLSMRTCFFLKVHHKIQLLLNVQYFNLIVLWFQWGNNCSALVCSNLTKFTLFYSETCSVLVGCQTRIWREHWRRVEDPFRPPVRTWLAMCWGPVKSLRKFKSVERGRFFWCQKWWLEIICNLLFE